MNRSPAEVAHSQPGNHRANLFSPVTMMNFSKMSILSTKAQRTRHNGEDTTSFTNRLLSTRTDGVITMDYSPARQVASTVGDSRNHYSSVGNLNSMRSGQISASTGRRTPSPVRFTSAPPRTPTRHNRIATNNPLPSTPIRSQAKTSSSPTIALDDNWTVWEDPELLNKFDPTACGESWVWDAATVSSTKESNMLVLVKKFALPWTSKAATKRMREEDSTSENATQKPGKPGNPSSKMNSENAQREHTVTSKYRLEAFLVGTKAGNRQMKTDTVEKTLTLRPLGERKLPETETIAHEGVMQSRTFASTKLSETGAFQSPSLSLRKSIATKNLPTGGSDDTSVSPSFLRKSASKLNLFETARKGSTGNMQIDSELSALSPIAPVDGSLSADSEPDFGELSPILPVAPPASAASTPTPFARTFNYIPAAAAQPPLLEEICTELQSLADVRHERGIVVERKRRKISNVA
ncbi:hypothetical protein BJ742DRAFT_406526 [Cladochytrium replicatum]|nr:hypothetical protein BJ742DRAFT_406526 [Cladochytrium replicatum]